MSTMHAGVAVHASEHLCITSTQHCLCCALGKTMRVKTLGTESEAERRLEALQEACLDRAFHISMDRVNYRASDRGQVQEEQEEVLQELKDLKNPEVRPLPHRQLCAYHCQHLKVASHEEFWQSKTSAPLQWHTALLWLHWVGFSSHQPPE